MKSCKILISLCGILILSSCGTNALDIDTSSVSVNIDYKNLDSLIVKTPLERIQLELIRLRQAMPEIIDYQTGYCMQTGSVLDTNATQRINGYRTDKFIVRMEQRISERFPNLPARHAKIIEGFKHLKAHLPKAKMPKTIVYTNSFFATSAFCTENEIALGLERYLGHNTDIIKELPPNQFYQWIKDAMEPEYLERDAVCAWIITHLITEKEGVNTAEKMINWGKIMYLTEAAFPEMEKHLIIRYNEPDYQWSLKNERSFWEFLVKQNLLFSKSETEQANLFNEAPFTAGLPEKGPDRLGQFLGWRIIQSYMNQYDVTLQELMALPYQEILNEYEINE